MSLSWAYPNHPTENYNSSLPVFPCYHIIHQLFKFPQFLSIIFKQFAAQSGVSELEASISTQGLVRKADLMTIPDLPSQNLCDRKFSSWFTGYQCLKNTILTFYKTVLFINFYCFNVSGISPDLSEKWKIQKSLLILVSTVWKNPVCLQR